MATTTSTLKSINSTIQLSAGNDSEGKVKYLTTSLSGAVLNPETYDAEKYGNILATLYVGIFDYDIAGFYENRRSLLKVVS